MKRLETQWFPAFSLFWPMKGKSSVSAEDGAHEALLGLMGKKENCNPQKTEKAMRVPGEQKRPIRG